MFPRGQGTTGMQSAPALNAALNLIFFFFFNLVVEWEKRKVDNPGKRHWVAAEHLPLAMASQQNKAGKS